MKPTKKDLLYDKELPYKEQEFYFENDRREIYYSALVKDLVKNNRDLQVFKFLFFGIVCLAFLAVCAFGCWAIFVAANKPCASAYDLGIAVTGFASILSSIIVLPTIIAKHLFPSNSEKVRFELIRDIQKFDQNFIDDDVYEMDSMPPFSETNNDSSTTQK